MKAPCLATLALLVSTTFGTVSMAQNKTDLRDEFFWLGKINKASVIINEDEGLLDKALAPRIAAGIDQVIQAGNLPGGSRPDRASGWAPRDRPPDRPPRPHASS